MQAVISYTAILCEGEKATWCKGGCGKFRYPYCTLENRPICPDCAGRLRLQVIVPRRKKQRVSVFRSDKVLLLPVKPKLPMARLCLLACQYQLLIFAIWWLRLVSPKAPLSNKGSKGASEKQKKLRASILSALTAEPKSSVELAREHGVSLRRIENLAAILIERGEIIAEKERSSRSCWCYGLPHQKEALSEKIGVCAKSLILKHLEGGALSARDLHNLIPYYNLKWISVLLWQMSVRGEIIGKGHNRQRVYALPGNDSGLEQRYICNPLSTKILGILRRDPYLNLHEISTVGDMPLSTTGRRLEHLENYGLIASLSQGRKKLYYVLQKP